MSRIRSRDTAPEMHIRKLLHNAGFRFRLHRKDLPGRPDIVLPKWKAVIDVRGCYWHAHGCGLFQQPKQNSSFWSAKLTGNVRRDAANAEKLQKLGWRHLIIWECALRGRDRLDDPRLIERMSCWLRGSEDAGSIPNAGQNQPVH